MHLEFQYLDLTLPDVAENLALDEALLVEAEEHGGPCVLRTWESGQLAVVMGASCRWRENVRVEACAADGVVVTRRSSGGGTVVIGPGALNFTVVLPIDAAPELKAVDAAQVYVLERTAAAIRRLGPPVEVLGSGDLTVGRRKFSGSAQRRLRKHVMIHASLLYGFPIDLIERYTLSPPRQPAYREGRPHADFVANVPLTRSELVGALREAWPGGDHPLPYSAAPLGLARDLLMEKFSRDEWIERL